MRWFRFIAAGMVVVAAVLAAPFSAYAWDVAKSTNGVILVREVTDTTTTVNVRVYYDYKGGGLPYATTSSYNSYITYTNALYATTDAYEVDLVEGYDRQLVEYGGRAVTVLHEPLDVSVVGTVPVSVSSTVPVSGSVTAAVDATLVADVEAGLLSIAGTLPVDVVSADEVLGVKPDQITAVSIIVVLTCGAVLYRAVA